MNQHQDTQNDVIMDNKTNSKPNQNIGTKILVALLCVLSFVAGMYAHKSRQINACQAVGGVVQEQDGAVLCQKPV